MLFLNIRFSHLRLAKSSPGLSLCLAVVTDLGHFLGCVHPSFSILIAFWRINPFFVYPWLDGKLECLSVVTEPKAS